MDCFPVGRAGRDVNSDPAVNSGIGLVENFVERGGIVGGSCGHVDRLNRLTRWQMLVLEIDSLALIGQFPIFHQQ